MAFDSDLAKSYSRKLNEQFGIYVQPIFYPTVPKNSARLRITVTPKHSAKDIDELVIALANVTGRIVPKNQTTERNAEFSSPFL
jgi:5-aminolevulinate synthase